MNKVAVFGNTGAGKSTLSKHLEQITGLPLFALDLFQYKPGGEKVSHEEYKVAHQEILHKDQWIIDGFGSIDTVWERLDLADTLVYLDLPIFLHYWWVTKRFLKGVWVPPEGWPENSPLLKGTLSSYQTVGLCHQRLTPKYRDYVSQAKTSKTVYHLQSPKEIKRFYQTVAIERQ